MKIYVGCALTQSPERFKNTVVKFKAGLQAKEHETLEFLGTTKGTPKEVYLWDIGECLKKSEAFIAICDYPGIGLGFELGYAQMLNKPILVLVREGRAVTRFLQGLSEVEANVTFERYKNLFADGAEIAARWLDGL